MHQHSGNVTAFVHHFCSGISGSVMAWAAHTGCNVEQQWDVVDVDNDDSSHGNRDVQHTNVNWTKGVRFALTRTANRGHDGWFPDGASARACLGNTPSQQFVCHLMRRHDSSTRGRLEHAARTYAHARTPTQHAPASSQRSTHAPNAPPRAWWWLRVCVCVCVLSYFLKLSYDCPNACAVVFAGCVVSVPEC